MAMPTQHSETGGPDAGDPRLAWLVDEAWHRTMGCLWYLEREPVGTPGGARAIARALRFNGNLGARHLAIRLEAAAGPPEAPLEAPAPLPDGPRSTWPQNTIKPLRPFQNGSCASSRKAGPRRATSIVACCSAATAFASPRMPIDWSVRDSTSRGWAARTW